MPPWHRPRRRRARPVADAPIDALLPYAADLAKEWMLALVERVSLDAAPAVVTSGLAVDGPELCDALLRALADDLELRRLEPGGALEALAARAGRLAGASEAVAVADVIDVLRTVLWAALLAELGGAAVADSSLVADLAERLALVCEVVRVAALAEVGVGVAVASAPPPAPEPAPEPSPPPASAPEPPAVPAPAPVPAPEPPPPAPATSAPSRRTAPLWIAALQDEIDRAGGRPLSLLLIELEDAERIVFAEGEERAAGTFALFAAALRGVARGQDILVRETDSRALIIARDTAREGASAVAARVATAVAAGTRWRGAPLTATVGVAVLGEDGRTAAELIDAAEEARFAASASGTGIGR